MSGFANSFLIIAMVSVPSLLIALAAIRRVHRAEKKVVAAHLLLAEITARLSADEMAHERCSVHLQIVQEQLESLRKINGFASHGAATEKNACPQGDQDA